MAGLVTFVSDLYSVIESGTGLSISPEYFDARFQPNTLTEDSFCVDIQSANTGKYRDNPRIRTAQTVTVSAAFDLGADHVAAQTSAYTAEEKIIASVMDRADMDPYTSYYVGTRRATNATREYYIISVQFKIDVDFDYSEV